MYEGRRAPANEPATLRRVRRAGSIIAWLLLPTAAFAQSSVTMRGFVHDSIGGVVSTAHIGIRGRSTETLSDSAGEFRLFDLAPGKVVLEVRRLGYRPVSIPVDLRVGSVAGVDVQLTALPEELAPVRVFRRAEAYDSRLAGFNERKNKHVGYFVTRDKLDRMSSARFVDALREIPGVSLRTLRGGVVTVSLRGARCAPMFYLDGFPATAGAMDLDMIDLSGVEGIEVYAGMASIPPEFMSVVGGERCGVIAVWSRPTKARKQRSEVRNVDPDTLLATRAAFTADQVDVPARLTGGSAEPVYPDSLWDARVPGRVVAEFVVDSSGTVENGSVRIVSTTDAAFAVAVAVSLEQALFEPAVLAGRPVRQIVLLPFVFTPASADSLPIQRTPRPR